MMSRFKGPHDPAHLVHQHCLAIKFNPLFRNPAEHTSHYPHKIYRILQKSNSNN